MALRATRGAVVPAVLAVAMAACSRPPGGTAAPGSPATLDPARPLPSPVPDVVARVNGQPVYIHQILPMAKAELDRVSISQREKKTPEAVRRALQQYVERELLLQEAVARGVEADARKVDWDYDQMRREHSDEGAWRDFLARQGMNQQALRAELRQQHTVAALLDEELSRALGADADGAARQGRLPEVREALLARLRARARIELFL